MKSEPRELKPESIPPSCFGPNGRLPIFSEDEHRRYIESALRGWTRSRKSRMAIRILLTPCSK